MTLPIPAAAVDAIADLESLIVSWVDYPPTATNGLAQIAEVLGWVPLTQTSGVEGGYTIVYSGLLDGPTTATPTGPVGSTNAWKLAEAIAQSDPSSWKFQSSIG